MGRLLRGRQAQETRLAGGEPVVLCDAPAGRVRSWSEDGTIVAALDTRVDCRSCQPYGGTVTRATELAAGELGHRWPHFLPGGKAVLFTVGSVPANTHRPTSLSRRSRAILRRSRDRAPECGHVASLPARPGTLPTCRRERLYVVPFDLDRLEVQGTAMPGAGGACRQTFRWGPPSSTSQTTGRWSTAAARRAGCGRSVAERHGTDRIARAEPAFYQIPRLSPDGSRLASVMTEGPNSDIWVYDWQRGSRTRLTEPPGVNSFPVWSPDGQYVVFQSAGRLFWARADGAEPAAAADNGHSWIPLFFHPERQSIVYTTEAGVGSLIQSMTVETKFRQAAGRSTPAVS